MDLEFVPQNTDPTLLILRSRYTKICLLRGWEVWYWSGQGGVEIVESRAAAIQLLRHELKDGQGDSPSEEGGPIYFLCAPRPACPTLWRPLLPDLHFYHLALDTLLCPLGHYHIALQQLAISGNPEWTQINVSLCVSMGGCIAKCVYMCRAFFEHVCVHDNLSVHAV